MKIPSNQYSINYQNNKSKQNTSFKGMDYNKAVKVIEREVNNAVTTGTEVPTFISKFLEILKDPAETLSKLHIIEAKKAGQRLNPSAHTKIATEKTPEIIISKRPGVAKSSYFIEMRHPQVDIAKNTYAALASIKNTHHKIDYTLSDVIQTLKKNGVIRTEADLKQYKMFLEDCTGVVEEKANIEPEVHKKLVSSLEQIKEDYHKMTLTETPKDVVLFKKPITTDKTNPYHVSEKEAGVVYGDALKFIKRNLKDPTYNHKEMINSICAKLEEKGDSGKSISELMKTVSLYEKIIKNNKNALKANSGKGNPITTINDEMLENVKKEIIHKFNSLLSDDEKQFLSQIMPEVQKHDIFRKTVTQNSFQSPIGNKMGHEITKFDPVDIYFKKGDLSIEKLKNPKEFAMKDFLILLDNYKKCLSEVENRTQLTVNISDGKGKTLSNWLYKQTGDPAATKTGVPGIDIDSNPIKKDFVFEKIIGLCKSICK